MSRFIVVLRDEEGGGQIAFSDVTHEADDHNLRIYKKKGESSPVAYFDVKFLKRWYVADEDLGPLTVEALREALDQDSTKKVVIHR